jgi:hypothetical protein
MRNGAPFSKPRVRLHGNTGDAQTYLGAAYNLLFKVRQYCEAAGVPVFAMEHRLENGAVVQAAVFGQEEIVQCYPPEHKGGARRKVLEGETPIPVFYGWPQSSSFSVSNLSYLPPEAGGKALRRWDDFLHTSPRNFAYDRDERIGSLTWWSNSVLYLGLPMVVSWFAGTGRYAERAGSAGTAFLTPDPLFESVWFNGRRVRLSGMPWHPTTSLMNRVWSAGLRRETVAGEEAYVLYVVGRDQAYKSGPLPTFGEIMRSENLVLPVTPAFALPKSYTFLTQVPVFNQSCTKLFISYGHNTSNVFVDAYEINVPSGAAELLLGRKGGTSVNTTTIRRTGNMTCRPALPYFTWESGSFTNTTNLNIVQEEFEVLASDYRNDVLVHATGVRQRVSNEVIVASASGDNPIDVTTVDSLTISSTESTTATVRIDHSLFGQLAAKTYTSGRTSSASYAGTLYFMTFGSGDFSSTLSSTDHNLARAGITGDLRVDSFWVVLENAQTGRSLTSSTTAVDYTSTITSTETPKSTSYDAFLFVGGALKSSYSWGGTPLTPVTTGSTSWPVGYSNDFSYGIEACGTSWDDTQSFSSTTSFINNIRDFGGAGVNLVGSYSREHLYVRYPLQAFADGHGRFLVRGTPYPIDFLIPGSGATFADAVFVGAAEVKTDPPVEIIEALP